MQEGALPKGLQFKLVARRVLELVFTYKFFFNPIPTGQICSHHHIFAYTRSPFSQELAKLV